MADGTIIFQGQFGYGVGDGYLTNAETGEQIPARILKIVDGTGGIPGVSVEVVMPQEVADAIAQKLTGSTIQVAPAAALRGLNGNGG